MSSLFLVVVGLSLVLVHNADPVDVQSRAAARQLLQLSLDVVRSLHALNFRLNVDNRSAVCYVIQQVSDVTSGDVMETEAWSRQPISIPLQLTEYRRKPPITPSVHVSSTAQLSSLFC